MPVFIKSGELFCFFMIFCGILLFQTAANGQDTLRSDNFHTVDSLSSLSFGRELNTYIWNGIIRKKVTTEVWNVDIYQHVRSRIIKTNKIANQDEYHGLISLRTRLSDYWNIQLKNSSNVLADDRAIDFNRMAQHKILAGAGYSPVNNIEGKILGGYELNSQTDENDRGFAYALGLEAQQLKLEDFDASIHSSWNQSFLGRRNPRDGDMSVVLVRDFGGGVHDSLTVRYSTQRREFYTSLSDLSQTELHLQHNIFQRDENVFEIMNQMNYVLDRDFSLMISIGLSNRLISRSYRYKNYKNAASLILDSHIQEMQFYGGLFLKWSLLEWLEVNAKLSYNEREERYSVLEDILAPKAWIEDQRSSASMYENMAQRTTIALGITADASQKTKINLMSSASILRYDTPDTSNTDDRDEILINLSSEVAHRFSRYLLLTVNSDLILSHLVYLHGTQSANNNWNRVIRLSPSIEFKPNSWFRTVARTEVLANYTISDYEQQVASVQSFSFRQVLWSDSAIVQLSNRIQCNFYGSLRIFERGVLYWEDFKESPEDYFIEKSIWPEFIWTSNIGLKIGIGYRYFGQDHYKYENGKKIFTQGIEASGPTALIEWTGSGSEKVTLRGWREEQKNNGTTKAVFSNISIQVALML